MRLLEHEAKVLLREFGLTTPPSALIRSPSELRSALSALAFPVMVKAQVPVGGRGKAGAVIEARDKIATAEAVQRLLGDYVRGYQVEAVLVEERIPIRQEFFLGMTYDTVSKQATLLASGSGGMDVEALSQTVPNSLVRRPFDVRRRLYDFEAREVAAAVGLTGSNLLGLTSVICRGVEAFLALDCTLLEINPLALTESGGFSIADVHLDVDEDALYRQQDLEKVYHIPRRESSGRTPTEFERKAAAIDALDHRGVAGRVIEFPGNLGLLIGGGGASLTAFDAVRRYGGKPANYCEIGGNPSVQKVAELTKLILSRPGVDRIAVISNVVSNTRVDLVARGVIKGILEAGKDPATSLAIFRVPGSWEEEGFTILQRYGVLYCDRTVSIDEAAHRAVAR